MWQQGGQARKWQERAILESSRTEGTRKGWKNRLGKRQLGWTRKGLSVLQTAFRNRAVTCWGTVTQGRHPGLTSDLSFNSTRNQVLFIASLGLCPALASLLAQMLWWMPITCQPAMFQQSNYNSAQSGKSPSPGLGPQGNLTAACICSQRPQLPEATRQSQLLLERLNPAGGQGRTIL